MSVTSPIRATMARRCCMRPDQKPHLDALAALARDKGLLLDQTGLHRGRKIVARKSEADIYAALGLAVH